MKIVLAILLILFIILVYYFNTKNGKGENFNSNIPGITDPNAYNDPAYRFRLNRNFEYSKKLDYSNPKKNLFQYNNQAYNIETFDGQNPSKAANAEKGDGQNPSKAANAEKGVNAENGNGADPNNSKKQQYLSDDIKRSELDAQEIGNASLISRSNTFGMVKNAINGTETPDAKDIRQNWANPLDPIGPVELEDPDITYYQFEGPPFNPAYVFNEPTKQSKIYPEAYYKPQGINNIGQLSRSYYTSRVFPEYPNVKYMYENSWDPSESYSNHNRYSVPSIKNSYGRTSITGVEKF